LVALPSLCAEPLQLLRLHLAAVLGGAEPPRAGVGRERARRAPVAS
jgi:hypothetical protein